MEIKTVSEFYRKRRVFVTGHTGFKGTWLSLMLENMGAVINGYALPTGNPFVSDKFYQQVSPKVERSTWADIADYDMLKEAITEAAPEIIFHFASHSSLYKSMEIPHYILKTNVMGALNVLEVARLTPSIKAVVIVTSDKVYRNMDTNTCYKETSQLGGDDPYSVSKVFQELLTKCYHETFFNNQDVAINVATARASNVIGPGDYNLSRLFPYLLDSFVDGNCPSIRNPRAIRPWQSVYDVCIGYLMLGRFLVEKQTNIDKIFNFGPSEEGFLTVGDFVQVVSDSFGNLPYRVIESSDRIRHEAQILKLDSTKAKEILGWQACMTIEKLISETVDFVCRERLGEEPGILARECIKKYFELIGMV